jgi:uncharacterized protein YjbJ (UPF0337 family)
VSNDRNRNDPADQQSKPGSSGQNLKDRGATDKVRGKLNQAGGKAQEELGQLTGKKDLKHKGQARQAKGKVQDTAGNVERKVDGTLNR